MPPSELVIELTSRCNLKCYYCFNSSKGELSKQRIFEVLNEAKKLNIPAVRFTGGEPLVRSDLVEVLLFAKKLGFYIMLNTNATLITDASKFKGLVDNVLVSLKTYESGYRSLTGVPFSRCINGIRLFQKEGIHVRLGTVATNDNLDHFDELASVAKSLSSRWEWFRQVPLIKQTKVPDATQLTGLINKIQGRAFITNAIPFCVASPEISKRVCMGALYDDGHSRLVLDPNGFFKPSYTNSLNLGKDLEQAWMNKFMVDLRNLEFLPKSCKSCPYKLLCKGGNRFIASLYGSFGAPDPLMNRENVNKTIRAIKSNK